MSISINVVNQKMMLVSAFNDIVSGTQEFVTFRFNLSEDWDGLMPFAQFAQNGVAYNQYLDSENCVTLPSEIEAGTCTLMLYGSSGVKRATTNYLTLKIDKDILISDASSTELTQSLYDQLVEMIEEFQNQGVTSNVIRSAVYDKISELLDSGDLSTMIIQDGTISRDKVDSDFEETLDKADSAMQPSVYDRQNLGLDVYSYAKARADEVQLGVDTLEQEIIEARDPSDTVHKNSLKESIRAAIGIANDYAQTAAEAATEVASSKTAVTVGGAAQQTVAFTTDPQTQITEITDDLNRQTEFAKGVTWNDANIYGKSNTYIIPTGGRLIQLSKIGGNTRRENDELVTDRVNQIIITDDDQSVEYNIPSDVVSNPAYGMSAGEVFNYIDFKKKKIIVSVKSLELNTLYWSIVSGTDFAYATISDRIAENGNIISSKYDVVDKVYTQLNDGEMCGYFYNNISRIAVCDSRLQNGMMQSQIREIVSGTLYYQTITPYEIDISDSMQIDILDWIKAESGSTVTFHEVDDSTTPIPFELNLISKLGEITSEITYVKNTVELAEFLNSNDDGKHTILCGNIIVTSPITLINRAYGDKKVIYGGTFSLSSQMFDWDGNNSFTVPKFDSCIFIGNGYNIFGNDKYILRGGFVNCTFINCGYIAGDGFVQTPHFSNCRFIMATNHPFIECGSIYGASFSQCNWENDNKSPVIVANGNYVSPRTVQIVNFSNCVIEGQTSVFVDMYDGAINFRGCYTESNQNGLVIVRKRTPAYGAWNPVFSICVTESLLDCRADVPLFEIDSGYEEVDNTAFYCVACEIKGENLISTENLASYHVFGGIRI